MPGYEPFLLCDFHVHTTWSDGALSLREVIDLYGRTRKFDVIAITDHILMKKDLLARVGRLATMGRRAFGIREDRFKAYLDEIAAEGRRAMSLYGLLVLPGAEITQNRLNGRKNSHIIALDIKQYISADLTADEILREIPAAGCAQHRLPSASPHDAADRDQHLLSVGQPQGPLTAGRCVGSSEPRRSVLGDEPQTLSLRRQQRLPQAATSLLVEDARQIGEEHSCDQGGAQAQRRRRADAVPQGRLADVNGRAAERSRTHRTQRAR
jgi:hypothetical protein